MVDFNIPLGDGRPWAVMCTSHSVMEGQRHKSPFNLRYFCLQQPKSPNNPCYSGGS